VRRGHVAVMMGILAIIALAVRMLWLGTSGPALPVLDSLGGNFKLPSTQGKTLALREFRGRVVLLGFGFTQCPDVCPMMMARVRATLGAMGDDARWVQPIFISLDPERDTLPLLSKYLSQFHPSIVGMTGTMEELERVTSQFKVYAEQMPGKGGGEYSLAHSGYLYLIDRQGRVRTMFAENVPPQEMAQTLRRLLIEGT
jgi:cytochrome oxidase Cu insertion factor (SCO1/SenC/PrrC family)